MVMFHSSLLLIVFLVFAEQVRGDFGFKDLYDVDTNCAEDVTLEECLSTGLVTGLKKLIHREKIPLVTGLELVMNDKRDNSSLDQDALKEEEIKGSKPRILDDRQNTLNDLMHRVLKRYTVRYIPEEERGKSKAGKFLIPFVLGMMLKLGTFLPMVLSVLKALALKSLVISKTALVLSLILALKKLLDSKPQHPSSRKPHVQHVYASPPSYGDLGGSGSNDLLHLGTKEQLTSVSRSEHSDFRPAVYGRSLRGAELGNSIVSARDTIHKTRTITS